MTAEEEGLLLLDKIQRQIDALAVLAKQAQRVAWRCKQEAQK